MKWRAILAAGTILLTGTPYAKPPDFVPPSQESICNSVSGAAFGLCISYCEAMDCDGEEAAASETACLTIRDRFVQLAGSDVPCEVEVCPCFDEFLIGTYFQQLTNDFSPSLGIEEGEYHCIIGNIGLINPTADPIGNTCSVHTDATWANEPFVIEPRIEITAEEAQSCVNILIDYCQ
jgi:hypothetical protein